MQTLTKTTEERAYARWLNDAAKRTGVSTFDIDRLVQKRWIKPLRPLVTASEVDALRELAAYGTGD